jgi:hypothetical protein
LQGGQRLGEHFWFGRGDDAPHILLEEPQTNLRQHRSLERHRKFRIGVDQRLERFTVESNDSRHDGVPL